MVFPDVSCPDVDQISETIMTLERIAISHTSQDSDREEMAGWFELLFEGLTFDLRHIGRPLPITARDFMHHTAAPPFTDTRGYCALTLVPGPHLSGGQSQMPIFRAQMALAKDLGLALDNLVAFAWLEGRSIIGRDRFRDQIEHWFGGGAFPVPGLISLKKDLDGGLRSVGLRFFTGQEVRIEPEYGDDTDSLKSLASHLVNQLLRSGPLTAPELVTGPNNHPLRLKPSRNGKFVRVWRG